jgi:membrane associated rhomboid family serine protease
MIPLRDVIPSRTVPYLTVSIIVLNALAWFYELGLPREDLPVFLRQFGVVPAYFAVPTLISSMFLHGSWSHVLGNVVLWIFGDNVEDRLGHFGS